MPPGAMWASPPTPIFMRPSVGADAHIGPSHRLSCYPQGGGILSRRTGFAPQFIQRVIANQCPTSLVWRSVFPLRLCWPGETGKTSAATARRREGTPPYAKPEA